jgi:hypothetical protein
VRLALIGLDPDGLYTAAEIALLAERANQTVRLVLHARLGKPEMIVIKGSLNLHAAWWGRDLIAVGNSRLEETKSESRKGILPAELKKRFWDFHGSLKRG